MAESDRCAGWKEGICQIADDSRPSSTCAKCGEAFYAPTDAELNEVLKAHYALSLACKP